MPDAVDSPFKSISILYRKSHVWLSADCASRSLTAAQALVILIVCDHETLTQGEIVKRLGLDKSVVAKTVAKLEETGFMVRETNARDRRTYVIRPTDRALEAYPFVREQVDACFLRMTSGMTDEERQEFSRLLSLAAETTLAGE